MKELKLTGWYKGVQRPVRVGVYARQYFGFIGFCYWNGEQWSCFDFMVKSCQENRMLHGVSPDQNLPWRGVSK